MLSKLNLAGEWGFRCDEERLGLANKFYELNADDCIDLPSTTSMAKKGRKKKKIILPIHMRMKAMRGFIRRSNLGFQMIRWQSLSLKEQE